MRKILKIIELGHIQEYVHFLNIGSQLELAATYRYFAQRGSVFALTSLYEPFGLAPLEAAATGLVPVVTKNGGLLRFSLTAQVCLLTQPHRKTYRKD
ncbi:MAG: hypothetical protein CM15mP85_18470 [Rhodobacterales bacterium]|nr:MAG: hypothetical protein CM15mP85_18470 [Rhodobacterales bacterium]